VSASDSGTTTRDHLLEECIERHGLGGDAAMETFLADHPGDAPWIRSQIEALRAAGLLEQVPRVEDAPREIGDFRLLRKLGEGGMGVVHLAEQRSLGRRVALKLLRPGQLYFGGARERFRREVEAVARLQHPGIVPVHVVGEHNNTPFFAMEFVEGCSLGEVLRSLRGTDPARLQGKSLAQAIAKRMPQESDPASHASSGWVFEGTWAEACIRVVQQAADALDHAHRRGVVHRDVKPSNLMITPSGRVLLVDFGLATMDGGSRLTRSGAQLGSLPYLAPEQVAGAVHEIGPRTDVYGLGVTLYELLTLSLPYRGASAEETMRKILEGRPPRLREKNPNIPRDAETVCLTAMERAAARRYASAADLARDLGNVLQSRPIEARRAGPLLRATRFAQRHPALSLSTTIAALAIVGLLGISQSKEHEKRVAIEREFERSEGLRLAAIAGKQIEADPGLALLLAIEAAERLPGLIANNALVAALAACREIKTLTGHSGAVRVARFSPDGNTIATGGDDGEICLWDGRTGAARARLAAHAGAVQAIEFSSDGGRFASAGSDGIVCLWTADAKIPVRVLRGHRGAVSRVRFSPDGSLLATASADGTVRLWDVESGTAKRAFGGHRRTADFVAFSPSGALLATASSDGMVRLFEVRTGSKLRELPNKGAIVSLAFDPKGERLLVAPRDTVVRIYSAQDGELDLELAGHTELVQSAEFDRSGDRVLTASSDNSAVVWDSHTGKRLVDVSDYYRGKCVARWVPGDRLFVTFSNDRAMKLLDAASGNVVCSLDGHALKITDADFSPDGARSVTAGENARLWNVSGATSPLRRAPRDSRVMRTQIAPNGRFVAFPLADGTTRILDVAKDAFRPELQGHRGAVSQVAFSRDGRLVATFGFDGTTRVHDFATGECLAQIPSKDSAPEAAKLGRGVKCGSFSPSGEVLALGTLSSTGYLWDWRRNVCLATLSGHAGRINAAEFSPDGKLLATCGNDGTIRLWNAITGEARATIEASKRILASIAFDQDGKRLVSCGYDRVATIWNLATLEVMEVIHVDDDDVFDAQFSPDGKFLATASADRTARLWELGSGREIVRVKGFPHLVGSVAFANANEVLAVSFDGTIRSFPTDPLAEARRRKPRELTLAERIDYEVGGNAETWTQVKGALDAAARGALWRPEVLARLAGDSQRSEGVRARAVAIVEETHDSARALSAGAWEIVKNPSRTREEYVRALGAAAAACERGGHLADYQRCLGVAYLRVGRFEEAALWLSKPECNHPLETDLERAITALALARAQEGAGQAEAAAQSRARFGAIAAKLTEANVRAVVADFGEPAPRAPTK
jgi:WD40 repeat protein/serine/threonine protein kinase